MHPSRAGECDTRALPPEAMRDRGRGCPGGGTTYRHTMSTLTEIGDRATWRCWLCDEPVDAGMSVNDPRGPSVDAVTNAKPKKGSPVQERLAHRACNTRKGAVKAVVPWPPHLFVVDPAPIVETADRLSRK